MDVLDLATGVLDSAMRVLDSAMDALPCATMQSSKAPPKRRRREAIRAADVSAHPAGRNAKHVTSRAVPHAARNAVGKCTHAMLGHAASSRPMRCRAQLSRCSVSQRFLKNNVRKRARLATIIVVAHAVVRVVLVLVLALAMVALSREAPHWR